MQIKSAKIAGATKEKSKQQREEEVIEKAQQEQEEGKEKSEPVEKQESVKLDDQQVLEHIKSKYGKEVSSLEDLFVEPKAAEPVKLPESITKLMAYMEETGRGIEDFVSLNKDYSQVDDDVILSQYFKATEPDVEDNDIRFLLKKYEVNDDEDDEDEIAAKRLDKKRAVSKARKYFTEQRDKFKAPLESRATVVPDDVKNELEEFKRTAQEAEAIQAENQKKSQWFVDKTNSLFSDDFKGFEVEVGDKKVLFKPGSPDELKKLHGTPLNFVSKYLNKDGYLEDVSGYHQALAIAMNWPKFAQLVWDEAQSVALENDARKGKNISSDVRRSPEMKSKDGMRVRVVESEESRPFRIRK